MRVRMVGIVISAALVWAVVPLSATATGCEADADADVTVPGDKSVSVEGACVVDGFPAGGSAEWDVSLDGDENVLSVTERDSLDRDGDGEPDHQGSVRASAGCGRPENWGAVKAVVCPVLDAT